MKEYENFEYFYLALSNTGESIIRHTSLIAEEIFEANPVNSPLKKFERLKLHLNTFLSNLLAAYAVDPSRYIAISMDNNYKGYQTNTPRGRAENPHKLTPVYLRPLVSTMRKMGFIDKVPGFKYPNSGIGKRTLIRATERLVDEEALLVDAIFEAKLKIPPIELRGEGKKTIRYRETAETRLWAENVSRYNTFLSGHHVDLKIQNGEKVKGFRPERRCLQRIFNNSSFKYGGRFYGGWWQEIPSGYRKHIHINDEPAAECDFSSMLPSTVYAMAGIVPEMDDLYTFTGELPSETDDDRKKIRELNKKIFTIALNCEEPKFIPAMWNAINEDKTKYPPSELLTTKRLDSHAEAFLKMHEVISGYFFSGAGLEGMLVESQITEKILLAMIEENIPILPVHDSYLVPWSYQTKLQEAMTHFFHERFPEGEIKTKFDPMLPDQLLDMWEGWSAHEIAFHLEDYSRYYTRLKIWQKLHPDRVHLFDKEKRHEREMILRKRFGQIALDNAHGEIAQIFDQGPIEEEEII